MGGRCRYPDSEGSEWRLERIGPFKSTGDYDWWQFGWDDTFRTNQILKEYPDGYYILNHFSGAVDKDGNIMEFPPIHVHHVHCSPGVTNPYRANMKKCLLGEENKCAQAYKTIFEQHGDYQCNKRDGGTRCLLEDMPEGYAKMVKGPITINGELNDARAKDSPEIEWYYQAAIRWVPKVKRLDLTPMGMHYFWSPGRLDVFDQSTMVNTYRARTDTETMIWYTGIMHYSGTLVRGKMHTHNTVFKESLFFAGSPSQLGMANARFSPPDKVYEPIPLKDMGFDSIDSAIQYIMDAYHKNKEIESDMPLDLICHGDTDNEKIMFPTGEYNFDRRAPTWCKTWDFKEGDQFTVIGFNQHAGGPPGPHMPDRIPSWLPGHLHWFLFADTHDGESRYEYGFYNQEAKFGFDSSVDTMIPFGGRFNTLTMILNTGMPSGSQWYLIVSVFLISLGAVASFFGFCTYKSYKLLINKAD